MSDQTRGVGMRVEFKSGDASQKLGGVLVLDPRSPDCAGRW